MNLDRFAVGVMDVQQAPVIHSCEHCSGEIYLGDMAIEYEMNYFCDKYCFGEYLIENADFREVEA